MPKLPPTNSKVHPYVRDQYIQARNRQLPSNSCGTNSNPRRRKAVEKVCPASSAAATEEGWYDRNEGQVGRIVCDFCPHRHAHLYDGSCAQGATCNVTTHCPIRVGLSRTYGIPCRRPPPPRWHPCLEKFEDSQRNL